MGNAGHYLGVGGGSGGVGGGVDRNLYNEVESLCIHVGTQMPSRPVRISVLH